MIKKICLTNNKTGEKIYAADYDTLSINSNLRINQLKKVLNRNIFKIHDQHLLDYSISTDNLYFLKNIPEQEDDEANNKKKYVLTYQNKNHYYDSSSDIARSLGIGTTKISEIINKKCVIPDLTIKIQYKLFRAPMVEPNNHN